ncbi:MAG: hypothetical protein SGBAC_010743 [Bacillariaceae sp.]
MLRSLNTHPSAASEARMIVDPPVKNPAMNQIQALAQTYKLKKGHLGSGINCDVSSTKQTNVELAWISFAQTGLSLFYGYGYFAAAKRALKVGDTSTPKLIPAYPMFQVELVYRAVPLFAVSRRLTKKRKYRRTEGLLRIKSGNANVQ